MHEDEFLIYDYQKNRYKVNWRVIKPWSLLTTEIELYQLIDTWPFVSGTLLDVGCGMKPYFLLFAPLVHKYVGVDLPVCQETNGRADIFADSQSMPFKSTTFDTVLCTGVLEHVPETLVFLQELNRVLKRGGHLILTSPQLYELHKEPYDFYRFTQYGLKYLIEKAGFDTVYIRPQGGLGLFLVDSINKGWHMVIETLDKFKNIIFPQARTSLADNFFIKYPLFLTQKFLLALYFNLRSKNGKKRVVESRHRYTLGHLLVATKK